MAIVGINLGKTVLIRTGKVEGVGGAEEGGLRKFRIPSSHRSDESRFNWEPKICLGGAVILKLLHTSLKDGRG